jgi:hypothetical protein
MKKPKQDRNPPEACREITAAIDCADFDADGFRIHTQDLLAHGQIFFPWLPEKGMGKKELSEVLAKEYARECAWAYEYQKEFLMSPPLEAQHFSRKWPSIISFILDCTFPLPVSTLLGSDSFKKTMSPAPAAKVYPLKDASHIFSETGQPALEAFARGLVRDYWLAIDWRKGPEAVERALVAWVKCNAPPNIPTLRGRNNAVDRFHELAAYRARRAGMDHIAFAALVGRTGANAIYSDQSQFLRASKATAKRIKKFDADVRRIVAAHRKKNK